MNGGRYNQNIVFCNTIFQKTDDVVATPINDC